MQNVLLGETQALTPRQKTLLLEAWQALRQFLYGSGPQASPVVGR
jgi:hypothetical protein